MFLGKLICHAGMEENFYVTYFPSYGAEVRGGTANCHVVLSNDPIASPVVAKATTLIIMNEPSLQKFESFLSTEGFLLLNSSLINTPPKRKDMIIESIQATDLAYAAGDVRVANMVMLGKYIACRNILHRESVIKNIKGTLADLNLKAFDVGIKR